MNQQNKVAPCIAESVEADFERGTWTFEPVDNFVVGSGRYVILPEGQYVQQCAVLELLDALKSARQVIATALKSAAPDLFETDTDISEHIAIKKIDVAINKATGGAA